MSSFVCPICMKEKKIKNSLRSQSLTEKKPGGLRRSARSVRYFFCQPWGQTKKKEKKEKRNTLHFRSFVWPKPAPPRLTPLDHPLCPSWILRNKVVTFCCRFFPFLLSFPFSFLFFLRSRSKFRKKTKNEHRAEDSGDRGRGNASERERESGRESGRE